MDARARALEVLESIEGGHPYRRGSGRSADERLVDALVSGVLRNRLLLDHFVTDISGRALDRIEPPVLQALRLGFYQLGFMRIPSHAAVSETVSVAGRARPRARGFVNAILRKGSRTDLDALIPSGDSIEEASIRLSHPSWMLERWSSRYGRERAIAIAAANQKPSTPDLLINRTRISIDDAHDLLEQKAVGFIASPLLDSMVRLNEGNTIEIRSEIEQGLFYPMDEGSAMVASLVPPESAVLDLAAAPGSKSIFLRSRNQRVTSCDIDPRRLFPMRDLWHRLFGERPFLLLADAASLALNERIDTVLLDAPCSATGIIRKHPEIRWRVSEARFSDYGKLQIEMARNAAALTRSTFVYSTCSLEPEENDHVIRTLLDDHPDLSLEDPRALLPQHLHERVDRSALRLLPDEGTDGFTIFVVKRKTS